MTSRVTLSILALLVVGICVERAWAQDGQKKPPEPQAQSGHHEVPDDPFIKVPRDTLPTSPPARFSRGGYVSVQVNVDANGNNMVGDAANEPSIAIDPTNPNRMVIGWRQFDTINNNFRQAGNAYTTDGGLTWTFPGVIEPGIFRSDPVLDVDVDGTFYYNSLSYDGGSEFWCHVFKSTDGGATWDEGTYAYGGDKQWMVIDRTDSIGQGHIYANWTQYWSICYPGHFIRSTDGGSSYQACTQIPSNPYWGTLSVGPDGELYVCGDGFFVAKSSNAKNAAQAVNWDFSRYVNLGGTIVFGAGPNPAGILGQAWIATDHSDGPTRGNVYLLSSVDPSGPDPLDVRFSRSTDGGNSWSNSVRVNDDSGNAWQWFGTMSVAPNGRIDAVWFDTRNAGGGYSSELYYAFSEDAGQNWSENVALSPAFNPHVGWPRQDKLGDYLHMISDNNGAHLAYAATFNGEQDVYYINIRQAGCDGDLDGDGVTGQSDLGILLGDWGCSGGDCVGDLDGDGSTGQSDLGILLGDWGCGT